MSTRPDENGRISVFAIKVPLNLALGLFEELTEQELEEHYYDIRAEFRRRQLDLPT